MDFESLWGLKRHKRWMPTEKGFFNGAPLTLQN